MVDAIRGDVSAVAVASSEDSEESYCILGTTIFASIVDQVVSGAPRFTGKQAMADTLNGQEHNRIRVVYAMTANRRWASKDVD